MVRRDSIWKSKRLSKPFLTNIRGGIPFANIQTEIRLRLIHGSKRRIQKFMDVGYGNGILAGAIPKQYPQKQF